VTRKIAVMDLHGVDNRETAAAAVMKMSTMRIMMKTIRKTGTKMRTMMKETNLMPGMTRTKMKMMTMIMKTMRTKKMMTADINRATMMITTETVINIAGEINIAGVKTVAMAAGATADLPTPDPAVQGAVLPEMTHLVIQEEDVTPEADVGLLLWTRMN
jgi:hypothetical protein